MRRLHTVSTHSAFSPLRGRKDQSEKSPHPASTEPGFDSSQAMTILSIRRNNAIFSLFALDFRSSMDPSIERTPKNPSVLNEKVDIQCKMEQP